MQILYIFFHIGKRGNRRQKATTDVKRRRSSVFFFLRVQDSFKENIWHFWFTTKNCFVVWVWRIWFIRNTRFMTINCLWNGDSTKNKQTNGGLIESEEIVQHSKNLVRTVLYASALVIGLVLSVFGNALTLIAIAMHRTLRSRKSCFIVNLALAMGKAKIWKSAFCFCHLQTVFTVT